MTSIAEYAVVVAVILLLLFGTRLDVRKLLSQRSKSSRSSGLDAEADHAEEPIPDVINTIRVERLLDDQAFILHGFNGPLTIAQGSLFSDPKDILCHFKIYEGIAQGKWDTYTVDPAARWPVQLHTANLLLIDAMWGKSEWMSLNALNGVLSKWMMAFDWSMDREFFLQEAETEQPVEDGFIRCLRIVPEKTNRVPDIDDRLRFGELEPITASICDAIGNFIQQESQRASSSFGDCDPWLRELYGNFYEGRTHPAFAILQQFDDGVTRIECAGSIISPTELRFWSRVAFYHK